MLIVCLINIRLQKKSVKNDMINIANADFCILMKVELTTIRNIIILYILFLDIKLENNNIYAYPFIEPKIVRDPKILEYLINPPLPAIPANHDIGPK